MPDELINGVASSGTGFFYVVGWSSCGSLISNSQNSACNYARNVYMMAMSRLYARIRFFKQINTRVYITVVRVVLTSHHTLNILDLFFLNMGPITTHTRRATTPRTAPSPPPLRYRSSYTAVATVLET